jgi:pimeloyl-ACP methyl ester carboxylesterase
MMSKFSFQRATARPRVVLLHSSASSSRQWSALTEALPPGSDVHAVDLHVHGAQPAWSGGRPLTLADEVALVEPLLHAADGVHLVGHSYGGAVAATVATMFPQAVRSLSVYEPVLFGALFDDDPHAAAAREVAALSATLGRHLDAGDDLSAAQTFVSYWAGRGAWGHMPADRRSSVAARMRAVHPQFDALRRNDFAFDRLPDCPTLFLTGAATVASTRHIGEIARRRRPQARHRMLDGMGHMGPITHASAVNRVLEQFLRECETPQATPVQWRWSELVSAPA